MKRPVEDDTNDEEAALVALYQATGGADWTCKENWLSSEPLSTWYGITVDNLGRVTGLELSGNNVVGDLKYFAQCALQLPMLDQLWLSDNKGLRGNLEPSLASGCLTILDLGNCRLSGVLPTVFVNNPKFSWLVTDGNELSPFARCASEDEEESSINTLVANTLSVDICGFDRASEKTHTLGAVHSTVNALSRDECATFIAAAEAAAAEHGWCTTRHKKHGTTDVDCGSDSALLQLANAALTRTLLPLLASLFQVDRQVLAAEDVFVVKYCAEGGGQAGLEAHKDGSELSFVVLLNDKSDFEGGGTAFLGDEEPLVVSPAEAGGCVSFCGLQRHAGLDVTKGSRYILAGFVRTFDDEKTRNEATAYFEGD
jgi:hypothetical protein